MNTINCKIKGHKVSVKAEWQQNSQLTYNWHTILDCEQCKSTIIRLPLTRTWPTNNTNIDL